MAVTTNLLFAELIIQKEKNKKEVKQMSVLAGLIAFIIIMAAFYFVPTWVAKYNAEKREMERREREAQNCDRRF